MSGIEPDIAGIRGTAPSYVTLQRKPRKSALVSAAQRLAGERTVKAAKPLILLFAVLGLVGMFLPMDPLPSMFTMLKEISMFDLLLMLLAFGLPLAAAGAAMSKPAAWQPLAAIAGFALAAIKLHIWQLAPHMFDVPLAMKLLIVGSVGGVIASIVGIVKPENA